MCDLTGPFKLCTCSSEIDLSKPHWVLHRFLESKEELFVCGEFINSNLIKNVKRRLNKINVFDFEYMPVEGDYLEFFIEIDFEEEDEIMPNYRFEYRKGKWKILKDYEMPIFNHKSLMHGIFKGNQM